MAGQRVDFRYVREQADFEAVASHYNITLQGQGDQRSCLCPFHEETKASCKINLDRRIFNCFGCDASGNVLDFVARLEGVEIRPAAIKLAEICGIDTAPPKGAKRRAEMPKDAETDAPEGEGTREVASAAEEPVRPAESKGVVNKPLTFTLTLDPHHPYIDERGVSLEARQVFGLGFANKGIMRGRIAIPIHDQHGNLVAYVGRWAEAEPPKDTARYLLPKGFEKQHVLYGYGHLPSPIEEITIVESYFSVIRLFDLGVSAVATMGTALSEEQLELLRATGASRALLLFDGDNAGRSAVEAVLPLLAGSFYVHAPVVPENFKPHRAEEGLLRTILHVEP